MDPSKSLIAQWMSSEAHVADHRGYSHYCNLSDDAAMKDGYFMEIRSAEK